MVPDTYDDFKRFLLIIRFGKDEPLEIHTKKAGPEIKRILDEYCPGEYEWAFSANDGSAFGYFIKTKTRIQTISRALKGELGGDLRNDGQISILLNDDKYLLIELGKHFITNVGKASGWLLHH